MNVSVEISLYPIAEDYLPPIQAFIDRLNTHPGIRVITNTMSTQVFGPYDEVLGILAREMRQAHENTPRAAFAIKVLNGDLSPE